MVEDRITDGKRIGQLLASELSGREQGALGRLAVTDADPDATPTASGTAAFSVTADGQRLATAELYPDAVVLTLWDPEPVDSEAIEDRADREGLPVETDETVAITVPSGAAVKRAVDALSAGVETE